MKKVMKWFIVIIVVFLLAGLAGFFILPPLAKDLLIDNLSRNLKRPVTIRDISINPWELSLYVRGFSVNEKDNSPFFSFEELYINAEAIPSLTKGGVVLKELRLNRPALHMTRTKTGEFNFSDLAQSGKSSAQNGQGKEILFHLSKIQVTGGEVIFVDMPMDKTHGIRDISMRAPLVSNMVRDLDKSVEVQFSAQVNGSPLMIDLKSKLFTPSRESHVSLDLRDLDLPNYLPYVPVKLNGTLVSAVLSAKMKIDFFLRKEEPMHLAASGWAGIKNISFEDLQKKSVLRCPTVNVDLKTAHPLEQDIHLSRLTVEKPEIIVRRVKDNRINLLQILPESGSSKSNLKLKIDELSVSRAQVGVFDDVPPSPVRLLIHPLDINVRDFSSAKGSTAKVDLSLAMAQRQGTLSAVGTAGMDPLNADFDLVLKSLAVRPFDAYFNDKIRINVVRGKLSSKGKILYSVDEKGRPQGSFSGVFSVADFASVDKLNADPFVNWKQLYFNGVKAAFSPFALSVQGISLTDYFARIIVEQDATLNIQNIMVQDSTKAKAAGENINAAPSPAQADESAADIKIGKVTLQGGTVDFSDRFIEPNYRARMLNMSGSVSGLSSLASTRARLELNGNLGRGAPISITGQVNPLTKKLFADMSLNFKNIELTPMTPYASKFLGHPIVKGKLTYDAKYMIDGRIIDTKNKVFIDQIALGDRVESASAIKAPIKLAVKLLEDRNGRINLDIPVSGDLDNPKFRVWPIVWQVLGNLIMKAATAPFALLASITGGGEEMSYIEFDYGSARVSEDNLKKFDGLIKILTEKPALNIDVIGRVDKEKDADGLKAADLARKVRAQKFNEDIKKGQSTGRREEIKVDPQEYEKYLTMAYREAPFPKARTALGAVKVLPAAEMEKLMLASVRITESDLRQLALRRAERVKATLLASAAVSPDRIFIVDANAETADKKDKAKESRVDIRIK